ncbi:Ion transport 2 domain protein [Streptomyces qinglanensis]|uniref:Ion transport 2 domain protein n=1 Tax=Streptomyces qinglanensis TaxID=943816 RepID=A0A1E7K9J7_9ACTN|nr:potassium channel family protein [Streptomyces qinglanensis]OEV00598.1 Ion transport 2 domain protein [Streptomyces qinglanensis]OEV07666.1 Ion transport 2 domain protein [Streptomyces nanshensis]
MDWLVSLLGAGLVLAALRDLFHTLWHPTRRGGASRLVMTALWRLSHLFPARRGMNELVGPLAMVTVVGMWTCLVVLGWALVYLPHMPEGFAFGAGLAPHEHGDLLDSLYVSLVNLATLGIGDIAPTAGWLRLVAPLEALVGLALLTATVSWVLQIYPALARRRSLALRLAMLRRVQPPAQYLHSATGAALLEGIAAEVVRIRVDFTQYPDAYYFHDGEEDLSLAATIGFAVDLGRRGHSSEQNEVRLAATVLGNALADLALALDQRFLRTGGTPAEVFTAYAHDHGRRPPLP